MKIRRFYSKNMRTALRQVTEEFGEDAAILSSQKTASGVEVIAALDYDEDLLPSKLASMEAEESKRKSDISYQQNLAIPADKQIEVNNKLISATAKDKELISEQNSEQISEQSLEDSSLNKSNPFEWSTDPGLIAMKEELGLMRSMMSEQLKGMGWQRFGEKEPTKAMLTRRFASLGVSQAITNQLLPLVKPQQDAECSWQNLLALLAKSITVNCQDILTHGGIFAFMGPTGSGKTSSIAKIAARFVIKHGTDSVALITTDDYRISAPQQLANFAKLLGIPMTIVSASRPIEMLLNQYKNKKLVLIDTAGMSKNDIAISKQLDSLQQTGKNVKRFLMLPATNQLAVLKQSVELFARYSPFSVIISKLDEAASLGEVLSLVIEQNLPVAFTTDGQRVPEDIRQARNHHLVSKAVWLTNKYGSNPDDWQLAQDQPQVKYA